MDIANDNHFWKKYAGRRDNERRRLLAGISRFLDEGPKSVRTFDDCDAVIRGSVTGTYSFPLEAIARLRMLQLELRDEG
jgi:hypothetical protein